MGQRQAQYGKAAGKISNTESASFTICLVLFVIAASIIKVLVE